MPQAEMRALKKHEETSEDSVGIETNSESEAESNDARPRVRDNPIPKKKDKKHERQGRKTRHKDGKKRKSSRRTNSRCALCGKHGTKQKRVHGRQCCVTGMCRGAYEQWKRGKSTRKVRAIFKKMKPPFWKR